MDAFLIDRLSADFEMELRCTRMPRWLAAFLLIYSAVAGRIERSWIRGPIVFVAVGFILGPDGLGVFRLNITGEGLRPLAELRIRWCNGSQGTRPSYPPRRM